jgi:hypothetical protein
VRAERAVHNFGDAKVRDDAVVLRSNIYIRMHTYMHTQRHRHRHRHRQTDRQTHTYTHTRSSMRKLAGFRSWDMMP